MHKKYVYRYTMECGVWNGMKDKMENNCEHLMEQVARRTKLDADIQLF